MVEDTQKLAVQNVETILYTALGENEKVEEMKKMNEKETINKLAWITCPECAATFRVGVPANTWKDIIENFKMREK